MKIITISGSMKFKKEMIESASKLELEGNIVIQCVYCDGIPLTEQDHKVLNDIHLKKIALSDAIFVVNVGGYIGSSTKKEIEYAKKLNKEVLYLEPIAK